MESSHTKHPDAGDELPQPPSARLSKTFGILGICSHALCLFGIPFAILFGALAIKNNRLAKREHAGNPLAYSTPSASGFVTGIVALSMVVSAIPINAAALQLLIVFDLTGQRPKAKKRSIDGLMMTASSALRRAAIEWRSHHPGQPILAEEVARNFINLPESQYPSVRNPYGGIQQPYELGRIPTSMGQVMLEPLQDFTDPQIGKSRCVVVLRSQYRRGDGDAEVVSKVVVLD